MEQVAVSGMNLDDFETGSQSADGGGGEIGDYVFEFPASSSAAGGA